MRRDVGQYPASEVESVSERDPARFGSASAIDSEHDGIGETAAGLPPEFLAIVAQASAEEIGALMSAHPELEEPIVASAHQLHGNAFVNRALASRNTLHKPTAPAQTEPNSALPLPAPVVDTPKQTAAPTPDPERAKHIARGMTAAWDQLAAATPDERVSPEHIRLPATIVKQLEKAWQDSVSGKEQREQGGNLVRNYGGSYEIRRGTGHSGGMYDPDDRDVGWTQKLVAQVHTHPYRDEKDQVPEQYATFSEFDFDSLMRSNAHMSVLRSGPFTYILSKTKQFNKLIDAAGNQEDKLQAIARKMFDVYNKAYDATEGAFSEKTEAGVLALCQAFHLIYYVGQGSDLTRKTKRPPS